MSDATLQSNSSRSHRHSKGWKGDRRDCVTPTPSTSNNEILARSRELMRRQWISQRQPQWR
jgi:hypothetical protein